MIRPDGSPQASSASELGESQRLAEPTLPAAIIPSDPAGSRTAPASGFGKRAVASAPNLPASRTPPESQMGRASPVELDRGPNLSGGSVPALRGRVRNDRRRTRCCAICGGSLHDADTGPLRFVFEGEAHGECWERRMEAGRELVETTRRQVEGVSAVARYLVAQSQQRLPSLLVPTQPPVNAGVGVPPARGLTARPSTMLSIITVMETMGNGARRHATPRLVQAVLARSRVPSQSRT